MATKRKSNAPATRQAGAAKLRPAPADRHLPKKFTGRLLVQLDPVATMSAAIRQAKAAGLNLAPAEEVGKGDCDGIVLGNLQVAIVEERAADLARSLVAAKDNAFVAAEPERYLRVLHAASKGRGKKLLLKDNTAATWGIHALNILDCAYTGKGVKVAVLDTGFDFMHPDFTGRTIHRKSFVGAKQAIDREGHGTHTAAVVAGGRKTKVASGTSEGVKEGKTAGGASEAVKKEKTAGGASEALKEGMPPGSARPGVRYGVAPGSRLFIGKIMDDNGEGSDGWALAGIEWALEKGCQVISMSLGAMADEDGGHSLIFEQVGQIAATRSCLLIAAAGNESERELGLVAAVNHPANCPSIMAVGALTPGLEVAGYSCAGKGDGSGQVDIAAPGDEILSARPGGGYRRESGTSMATAFVSGLAVLLWEKYPKASAGEIWAKLVQQARRLPLPASDVGAGLVGFL